MTATRTVKAITQKQLDQREALWPKAEPRLWHRKVHDGFTTIPKTMPLVLQITDEMSNGKPLSATYLSLWRHLGQFIRQHQQAPGDGARRRVQRAACRIHLVRTYEAAARTRLHRH